ncbi:exonuclease domain-containing protein [Solirubrobacter pauli]|nr:exonuclease domain-containing protein [Solirubrobacter pauli]
MLDLPLATAEFVAVDTETNGLSGDKCELTEIGAVLVGGGELHEEWDSLVGVAQPLGRYIQRFTGISQSMVDDAPAPEDVLPRLANMLRGRVLVAHNSRFDVRVLRQAFARAALEWPDPPVICTVQMARRFAPLQRRRGLATLAGALGIDVEEVHRALPDARTCARVFCALFGRLCANAPTIGDAITILGAKKVRKRPASVPNRPRGERPHLAALPHEPGVYIFRDADGQPLYVGKSVDLRVRARSHFTSGASWTQHAEHVDHTVTESELGALLLEDRLIKALKPPGNVKGKSDPDGYVYIRCRLDIPFPILEVALEPAVGHAVCVGPVRGRAAAAELVEQLNSLFGLRHCGRSMPRRAHPSAYGQMGRCLSPCLNDLDPNVYRERLDEALRLFVGKSGAAALLARVDDQIREASAAQRYERAAWLQRRRERLESLLARLGGVLRAIHTGARLVLAPHPSAAGRFDPIWVAGGRVVDWGAAESSLVDRSMRALKAAPPAGRLGGWLSADAVAEARLVGAWIALNKPPTLELGPRVGEAQHERFLSRHGFVLHRGEGERGLASVAG